MTLTLELTRLIRAKRVEDADLRDAALMALDAVANAVAGLETDAGKRILSWIHAGGNYGGDGLRGDAGRIAFALGALTHILEVDDLHRASVTHPGCAVVPALFAHAVTEAENDETVDGRAALTALLHGYEATARLGMAVGTEHYKVWHNTATCGPFGSAMAMATLESLSEDACVHALGNAGTQAAGLWEFLDTGAMSKHLHAGRAAEAGVVAAQLAAHGFTGAPAILEGQRGFFAAMCPDGDPAALVRDPDAPWQARLTSIKPWPSCRHTHPAIDAAQELRAALKARKVGPEAVARIDVGAYQAALALCDRPRPESEYAAKFSLQHCVAAALALDEVWFDAFDEARREALASLRSRVHVRHETALERAYPRDWGASVQVTLASGETLEASRASAKGDPEAPLSADELIAKAKRLLHHGRVERPEPFIEAVLAMTKGGPVPLLPPPLGPIGDRRPTITHAAGNGARRAAS